jgi:hypothetical protein
MNSTSGYGSKNFPFHIFGEIFICFLQRNSLKVTKIAGQLGHEGKDKIAGPVELGT